MIYLHPVEKIYYNARLYDNYVQVRVKDPCAFGGKSVCTENLDVRERIKNEVSREISFYQKLLMQQSESHSNLTCYIDPKPKYKYPQAPTNIALLSLDKVQNHIFHAYIWPMICASCGLVILLMIHVFIKMSNDKKELRHLQRLIEIEQVELEKAINDDNWPVFKDSTYQDNRDFKNLRELYSRPMSGSVSSNNGKGQERKISIAQSKSVDSISTVTPSSVAVPQPQPSRPVVITTPTEYARRSSLALATNQLPLSSLSTHNSLELPAIHFGSRTAPLLPPAKVSEQSNIKPNVGLRPGRSYLMGGSFMQKSRRQSMTPITQNQSKFSSKVEKFIGRGKLNKSFSKSTGQLSEKLGKTFRERYIKIGGLFFVATLLK